MSGLMSNRAADLWFSPVRTAAVYCMQIKGRVLHPSCCDGSAECPANQLIMKTRLLLQAFAVVISGHCWPLAEASESPDILAFGMNGKRNMLYDVRQRPQSVFIKGRVYIVYNGDATPTAKSCGRPSTWITRKLIAGSGTPTGAGQASRP